MGKIEQQWKIISGFSVSFRIISIRSANTSLNHSLLIYHTRAWNFVLFRSSLSSFSEPPLPTGRIIPFFQVRTYRMWLMQQVTGMKLFWMELSLMKTLLFQGSLSQFENKTWYLKLANFSKLWHFDEEVTFSMMVILGYSSIFPILHFRDWGVWEKYFH